VYHIPRVLIFLEVVFFAAASLVAYWHAGAWAAVHRRTATQRPAQTAGLQKAVSVHYDAWVVPHMDARTTRRLPLRWVICMLGTFRVS